ncbi:hypothetical protein GGI00_004468 [Coemansia sp. RSA 2681]|nr:hypothetical protein GGI00_004468 [Coemansia sp. RSA 2681]
MLISVFLPLLLVGRVAVAKPDVAGTRTVVISLATGEGGQIIPFVLHRNSHGFDPITIYSSEEQTSALEVSDTGVVASTNSEFTSGSSQVSATEASNVSSVEASAAELSSEATESESVSGSSIAENTSTESEDLGSGSDSDSDSEESNKSAAANGASNSSHASKKSGASAHALPNAAVFFAIPACLCAASLNRAMF